MKTVFVGGSRHVSRLPAEVKGRLDDIIGKGLRIVVGDAAGVDKAVQQYLVDASYPHVTVFCSGDRPRNNLGMWKTCKSATEKCQKGFQFHAAKDREMAREADFGLMIWDGKSAGTALNVLRLVRAGKKARLLNIPDKQTLTFKTADDWSEFLSRCDRALIEDLRTRATPEEWLPVGTTQPSVSEMSGPSTIEAPMPSSSTRPDDLTAEINAAFASGDLATAIAALGDMAKAHGMSQVAKEAGLARESLYRSLNGGGNPELSTVMKVMSSVGLRLTVSKTVGPFDGSR